MTKASSWAYLPGGAVLSAWDRIAWDDDDNRLAEQVRQLQTTTPR